VRSLLGTLGGISGGKLYILGVAGYDTPIWDVLALQGEQEEAGERLHGAKFENYIRIRQVVSDVSLCSLGSLLGSLATVFHYICCTYL